MTGNAKFRLAMHDRNTAKFQVRDGEEWVDTGLSIETNERPWRLVLSGNKFEVDPT